MSGSVDGLKLDRGEPGAQGPLAPAAVVGGFGPGDDRAAELVAGVPAALRTFFGRSAKKDSIAALSADEATRPMDPRRPCRRKQAR